MAHVNLHLAAGLASGMAVGVVPVVRAWIADRPLARAVGFMIAATCALGIWAIVPNLAHKAGIPIAGHRIADVFVLHTALDRRTDGGLLVGELVIAGTMFAQYAVVIAALVRARRRGPASPPERLG
jgi:hypothetical protein